MKVVNFREDYSKLKNKKFGTIRKESWETSWKYKLGEICLIKSPSNCFKAKCICRGAQFLDEINNSFLMEDTDTNSRKEAINHLKNYYPNLNDDSELVVYGFEKVEV